MKQYHLTLLSFSIAVCTWEITCHLFAIPKFLLPSPSAVAQATFEHGRALTIDLAWTAAEAVCGFAIACIFAMGMSIVFLRYPITYRITIPYLIALKSAPVIALSPLLILWLGNGFASKVAISGLVVLFPIVINAYEGLHMIPTQHADLANSMGATWWQSFLHFRLPHSMPFLVAGLKIASTLSVVGATVGEFTGAYRGLGVTMLMASMRSDTTLLVAAIILATSLALTMYFAIEFLERRYLKWHNANARFSL